MKIKIICIYLIVVTGCISSHSGKNYFVADGEGEILKSTVLGIDSIPGYNLCELVLGDKLIQYLVGDKYSYAVYNIKGDSLFYEGKFLLDGNGPYEIKIAKLQYISDRNEMIISGSASENDFYTVDLDTFTNLYDTRRWKRGKLPVLVSRYDLAFVNDSVYLHLSYPTGNNMFSLAYKGKDSYSKDLNFVYPIDETESSALKFTLFWGKLIKHPSRSSFIYSNSSFKYVILFDLEDEEMKNVCYLSAVLPEYTLVEDNPYWLFSLKKDTEDNCRIIHVTERFIYIGYNNMTLKDVNNHVSFKGYPNGYFDRINVFDWEGNFIKRLVLEKPVYCFSVSQDDTYLYASSIDLTQENHPDRILRFELKVE